MGLIRKTERLDAMLMRARGDVDDEMTAAITHAVRAAVLYAREERAHIDWTTARLSVRLNPPDDAVAVDFEVDAQETITGGIAALLRLLGRR